MLVGRFIGHTVYEFKQRRKQKQTSVAVWRRCAGGPLELFWLSETTESAEITPLAIFAGVQNGEERLRTAREREREAAQKKSEEIRNDRTRAVHEKKSIKFGESSQDRVVSFRRPAAHHTPVVWIGGEKQNELTK